MHLSGYRNRALAVRALGICLFVARLSAQVSGEGPTEAPRHSLTFLLEGKAFAEVPAGEFTMGSESGNPDEAPVHRVRIANSFEMGRFEVTQAQWRTVMDSPHSKPKTPEDEQRVDPSHFKGAALPVESVSWDSVQTFLRLLNARDQRYTYRLPTEAEWEYAARAEESGESTARTDAAAWCEATSGGRTHPVGEKAANAWGLHDMLGNVMEWVQDGYAPDYYSGSGETDPRGPESSSYKVFRGGAWLSGVRQCRAAFRGFDFPNSGYYSVGFRLVRTRR